MKKISALALAAAFSVSGASALQAKDKSSAGGLELSGNVTVVTGFQHDTSNGQGQSISPANTSGSAQGLGILGEFRGPSAAKRTTYNFYLDQVELDLNKTFGENIRVRADLDFGRDSVTVEQGYVTANIPVGNGMELLVGRFNAPIGLESVDRHENIAISNTNLYRFLRPHNVTGAKVYYAFNENFDWHLYAVNNLVDEINTSATDTAIPSVGTRFGFTWGEQGKEHVIGLSYAGGPEGIVNVAPVSHKKHWTHIGDLDFSFHVTDDFIVAGEAIYRQDNRRGACPSRAADGTATTGTVSTGVNANKNCKALAGQITLAYDFNENWNAWLRYDYIHDLQGNYTENDQQIHAGTVGLGYNLTEGANIKGEYRLDTNNVAGVTKRGYNHGFALQFAYNF